MVTLYGVRDKANFTKKRWKQKKLFLACLNQFIISGITDQCIFLLGHFTLVSVWVNISKCIARFYKISSYMVLDWYS